MNKYRKLLSFVLVLIFAFTLLPSHSYAGGGNAAQTLSLDGFEVSYTATEDGTLAQVSTAPDLSSNVYLLSLPYGATLNSVSYTENLNIVTKNELETGSSNSLTAFPDESLWMKDTDFNQAVSGSSYEVFRSMVAADYQLPQENVKGFLLLSDSTFQFLFIQISTTGGQSGIDISELKDEIAKVWDGDGFTDNYYTETDRWNGTKAYPKDENNPERGFFWATTQEEGNPLEAALGEFTSQSAVDNALEKLQAAIDELIPSDQANTTLLYEAVEACKNITNGTGSAKLYTDASWNAFVTARDNAQALLGQMFDANGNPLADNNPSSNEAINAAAAALTQAYEDLLYADLANEIPVWKRVETWLLSQTDLNADEYSNWSTWANAYDALSAWRNKTVTLMSDYEMWTGAIIDAAKAYTGLKDAKDSISVHVRVADNFGALYPDYALSNAAAAAYDDSVSLNGSHSIDALLTAIGYDNAAQSSIPYNSSTAVGQQPCVMVYINGTLVVYRNGGPDSWSGTVYNGLGNKVQTVADIQLHDGDDVIIVRAQAPYYTYYIDTIPNAPYTSYYNSAALLDIQSSSGVVEVEAGSEFSMSIIKKDGAPENTKYGSSAKPAYGISFFLSDVQTDGAAAQGAFATTPTDAVTDGSGSASLTIYVEGWYKLFVADVRSSTAAASQGNTFTEGTYPNLAGGDYVLVHVKKSEDDSAVRAELQAELDEVYYAYGQDFYTEEQWETVTTAYQVASETIRNTELLGDAYNAQKAAIETIEALQKAINEQNEAIIEVMRGYLKFLPSESQIAEGKFTQNDVERMGWAGELYASMTEYQKSILTSAESKQWQALTEAFGDDGAGLPAATTYKVSASVVNGDDNMTLYLDAWYFVKENEWGDVNWSESCSGVQELEINYGSTRDDLIALSLWVPVENEGDDPLQSASFGDAEIRSESWGYVFRNNKLFAAYSYNLYNPRRDFTIVLTMLASDELAQVRSNALAALEESYNGYSRSKYTDENWTTLREAYQNGVESINAATNETEIQTALDTALRNMAAVPKKAAQSPDAIPGWGEGSRFNAGKQVGTVTVIAENTTFPGGAFTGTIFNKPNYAIGEKDNMMTVILRALADEGFTWDGTGGSEYSISYLSSISKDGMTMGEFSGDPGSGWMGTLNDFMVNEGLSQFSVTSGALGDGDVISLVYTQNLGVDLGSSWGNSDTTLKSLEVSTGTLIPGFASGEAGNTYDFALMIPGSSASILVTPHAANINYMVKTFLNEKVTSNDIGNSFYRRTETINVHPGDVIYVGCGERAWPSMNKQGDEASAYTGTWYALHVISANDGADYVNELIAKLPAGNKITLSNYKNVLEQIAVIDQVKAALSSSEQAKVNTSTLEAARERAESFKAVDEVKALLAALPKSSNLSDNEVIAARRQIEAADAAYKALSDEQKGYITVGDSKNYNALVERLAKLTITSASTIIGAEEVTVPISGEQNSIDVAVTVDGTKATISEVDMSDLGAVIGDKVSTGTVTIDFSGLESDEAITTVEIPADTAKKIAEAVNDPKNDAHSLEIVLSDGASIEFDAAALKEMASQANGADTTISIESHENVTLTNAQKKALGDRPAFDINVTSGGKHISDMGGKITVHAPYVLKGNEKARGIVVWYVDDNGNKERCVTSYDPIKKRVNWKTDHLSLYMIDYDETLANNPFTDVTMDNYYFDAVLWAVDEGITVGTSDTTFSPDASCTRAQMVTFLWRAAGSPKASASTCAFTDVDKDAYYYEALLWAVENGITNGTSATTFSPNASCTRGQMATFLYRDAKSPAVTGTHAFTDVKADAYYNNAVIWAAAEGITKGTSDTTFSPDADCTRGQMVTFLYRYLAE